MMDDYMLKIMTDEKDFIGVACVTTRLVNEAAGMHGTYPTASAVLGRALTGCELMASLLDPEQRVALKFEGDGPLGKAVAEADGNGAVRGYVSDPLVDLPPREGKLDVSGALGKNGFLTVSKDLGLKEPYRGVVRLYNGEMASDIAYYYSESEQIPSAVGIGVFVEKDSHVSAAGGFLVQTLPGGDERRIDSLIDHIERMDAVTSQIREGRLPEDILAAIFRDMPYRVIEKRFLAFVCSCSRERIEQAIIALGRHEISEIISGHEDIEVSCQFCGKRHVFRRQELERMLHEMH